MGVFAIYSDSGAVGGGVGEEGEKVSAATRPTTGKTGDLGTHQKAPRNA